MDFNAILAAKDERIAQLEKNQVLLEQELQQLKKLIFGSQRERFISETNSNLIPSLKSNTSNTIARHQRNILVAQHSLSTYL